MEEHSLHKRFKLDVWMLREDSAQIEASLIWGLWLILCELMEAWEN